MLRPPLHDPLGLDFLIDRVLKALNPVRAEQ